MQRRRKKRKYLFSDEQWYATFTPFGKSVDEVLAQQMNSFVEIMVERLAERVLIEHSSIANYIRTRYWNNKNY